jgi:hypothetical protein
LEWRTEKMDGVIAFWVDAGLCGVRRKVGKG